MTACPICATPLHGESKETEQGLKVSCLNCGGFVLSGTASAVLSASEHSPQQLARIAYGIRRRGGGSVTTHLIEQLIEDTELPDAPTLIDNLLLYVSSVLTAPGESVVLAAQTIRASIGAMTATGAGWALREAVTLGLLAGSMQESTNPVAVHLSDATLTLSGWRRVDDLNKSAKDSRKAFMAMKYGDSQLDEIFRAHIKPAVRATGFELIRLDEEPRAGLIDDRLRLEIRTSRMLIADLTHANNGAYWEAGFAEGLGRPVIYTCRKDVFDSPVSKPHFDTNHYLTVVWDPSNISEAVDNLKATIRVTLPAEALLTDDTSTRDPFELREPVSRG